MALHATVCKAVLHVSDVGRNCYAEHALTIARRPSETDERMMVRLLAFALNVPERLFFGQGLADADEPDLWQKDLTGAIAHWIEVGQPDEKTILRAWGAPSAHGVRLPSRRRARVGADGRLPGAGQEPRGVAHPHRGHPDAGELAARSMRLQCTIQDGQVWLSDAARTVEIEPVALEAGA